MLLLKTLSLILVTSQASAIDLNANWLDGGMVKMRGSQIVTTYKIEPKHIDRLVELMQKDTETKALYESFLSMFTPADPGALKKSLRLCRPEDAVDNGGQAQFKRSRYAGEGGKVIGATIDDILSGLPPEEYFKDDIDQIEWHDTPSILRVSYHPDYVQVRPEWGVDICLTTKLTILQAYNALVHELAHVVKWERHKDFDMLKFADDEDYMYKVVLEPGDEVEAYIAGNRAQIRLESSLSGLMEEERPFFNAQGDFIGSREKYAKVIVDDMKYRQGRFAPYTMRSADTGETWTESEFIQNFNRVYSNEQTIFRLFKAWLKQTNKAIAARTSESELVILKARTERLEAEIATRAKRLKKYEEFIETQNQAAAQDELTSQ